MLRGLKISSWDPVALPSAAHNSGHSLWDNAAATAVTKPLVLDLTFRASLCWRNKDTGGEQ